MHLAFFLLTLVLLAYHLRSRQVPHPRHVVAYFLALGAISAFTAGFYLAVEEDALGRYGRVVPGTITNRYSTTGEQGTPTIGRGYRAFIRTSNENEFYDMLARLVATGSAHMWVVDYRYPCEAPRPCWERSVVSHQRWAQLRAGQTLNIRYVTGTFGGARLEDQPLWAAAIARMAIGVILAAAAALAWGTGPAFRRVRTLTTLAVVTEVEPVRYRGGSRWRVKFSYLDRDGTQHEASDEFASPAWKPGDTAVAMYEPGNPKAAGLRPSYLYPEFRGEN